jgi:signal transduction histidine kinase
MLTTITTVNIFAEILSAGVCFAMFYVFCKRGLQDGERSDLYLSVVFLLFGLFVSGMTMSRLLSNYGVTESVLLFIQRFTTSSLAFGSIFVFAFVMAKRGFKISVAVFYPLMVAGFVIAATAYIYPMTPAVRSGVVDPVSLSDPFYLVVIGIWDFSWAIFAAYSLLVAAKSDDKKVRSLSFLAFWSALVMVISFIPATVFMFMGMEAALLVMWILLFFSLSGIALSNLILPEDDLALHPLSFVRSSILLKIVSILVFLIIITVEATALVTIAISKRAITKELVDSDRQIVFFVNRMIKTYSKQPGFIKELETSMKALLTDIEEKQGRSIFITDDSGKIIVSSEPDNFRNRYFLIPVLPPRLDGNIYGGVFEAANVGKMLGALGPADMEGWKIIVSRPIDIAYMEIRKMETTSLAVFIAGILIAFIIGGVFSKNIEDRIRSIIGVTEAVRRGDLNRRIPETSIDEIGHLAREFNMMTAELKESQDHLIASEKLAALGTMAAGMAHEIKNPLVALRTFSQLLPLKWEDKEFRNKFASVIPPEIDKINKIAENLLKFGRPSKPEFKPIDIETVLEEVLELVDNQIKKNNIRVGTKFVKTPKINADPSQLSQAFLNIIMNAIQAMKDGGELVIKTDVGHVIQLGKINNPGMISGGKTEIKDPGKKTGMVFIEVTDSGPGISEENMKNMFDPFFTTKEAGTGMGLPITLRIIEDHRGSIKLRSQIGKGTTFIIMLPPIEGSSGEDQTI